MSTSGSSRDDSVADAFDASPSANRTSEATAVDTGTTRTTSATERRLVFLDALRGLAALNVAWSHFFQFSRLAGPLHQAFPWPLAAFCYDGRLGVDVFFVLSGFVNAYSVRDAVITRGFIGRFALRRSLRLDPPYWVTVWAATVLLYVGGGAIHSSTQRPSIWAVLAHMLYAQHLLDIPDILPVYWTLTYEVQFYLVFVSLLALAQHIWRGGGAHRQLKIGLLFSPLLLASATLTAIGYITERWFINFWYAFFLGAVTCWTLIGQVRVRYYVLTALVTLAIAVIGQDPHALMVVIAATVILAVGRAGKLSTWLNVAPLQYLGRISYSLYLVHQCGFVLASRGPAITRTSPAAAVGWFVVVTAVSIAAADMMHRLIEAPSIRLAKNKRLYENVANWVRFRGREVSGFAE